MESKYLNNFHEQLYKRAEIFELSPPKRSWQERIDQYHRIKALSTRAKSEQQSDRGRSLTESSQQP
jgi:hypothetical protein